MVLGRQSSTLEQRWQEGKKYRSLSGHPFYQRLNFLLEECDFDDFVEDLCGPYYASRRGRPSVPPGRYFRMLMVGELEGIASWRQLAWRCADSLALRDFLGIGSTDPTPDHSTLSVIRKRIPAEVHESVLGRMKSVARDGGLRRFRCPPRDRLYSAPFVPSRESSAG